MNKQKGFTLIELIIVIIILGILAAFAIPKYMSLDKEARISTVRGLDGAIHAAAEMVHSIAVAQAVAAGSSVNIGTGANIQLGADGRYPAANDLGINAALSDTTGFTFNGGGKYTKNGATDIEACKVTYTVASDTYTSVAIVGNC